MKITEITIGDLVLNTQHVEEVRHATIATDIGSIKIECAIYGTTSRDLTQFFTLDHFTVNIQLILTAALKTKNTTLLQGSPLNFSLETKWWSLNEQQFLCWAKDHCFPEDVAKTVSAVITELCRVTIGQTTIIKRWG